jgi:Protein of unknown function (DUF3000)
MAASRKPQGPLPEPFRQAVRSLRSARVRPEVEIEESPAPQRLAPYAVALSATVRTNGEELAHGRLVLLHDPTGHEAWQGTFRLVAYVRAELEPEMVSDPLLPRVAWGWLVESVEAQGLPLAAASGTVTRVESESFGALAGGPVAGQLEIRASWTPVGDVREHVEAWADVLCAAAGLPPVPPGVASIPNRRAPRER